MTDLDAPSNKDVTNTTVVAVAPFPPPVHGMAQITERIVEDIAPYCHVVRADISPGRLERGLAYHTAKVAKVARALVTLLTHAFQRPRALYTPVGAGLGMFYTTATVALARLLGYTLVVHHHSFAYIDRRTFPMRLLACIGGKSAWHLFLCDGMKAAYRRHYPGVSAERSLVVSNGGRVDPVGALPARGSELLTIGHLSNLGPEKGLDDVLETARRLQTSGASFRLLLAGPTVSANDKAKIDAAKSALGDNMDYRGPVYGADKDRFYAEVDVFLFPTRYHNEAQPTVLFEAMAFGVPSISYARGCIANDLSEGGGMSVAYGDDFTDAAVPVLTAWAENRPALDDARGRALTRGHAHKRAAAVQFDRLVEVLTGAAVSNEPVPGSTGAKQKPV